MAKQHYVAGEVGKNRRGSRGIQTTTLQSEASPARGFTIMAAPEAVACWGGPVVFTPIEAMTTYTWMQNDPLPLVMPMTRVRSIDGWQATMIGTTITPSRRSSKIEVFLRDKVNSSWRFRRPKLPKDDLASVNGGPWRVIEPAIAR